MKCNKCEKPATFHITERVGKQEQWEEVHLCEDCARDYLSKPAEVEFEESLAGVLAQHLKVGKTAEPATTVQHLKSGAGIVQFLTVLAPLQPDEGRRIASVAMEGETCTIELADGRHAAVRVPADPSLDMTPM